MFTSQQEIMSAKRVIEAESLPGQVARVTNDDAFNADLSRVKYVHLDISDQRPLQ
jgi:hypothetical protein